MQLLSIHRILSNVKSGKKPLLHFDTSNGVIYTRTIKSFAALVSIKTVRMVHYEGVTALDTVRIFIKQHGIKSEEVAQALLKELQVKIQQLPNNSNSVTNRNHESSMSPRRR